MARVDRARCEQANNLAVWLRVRDHRVAGAIYLQRDLARVARKQLARPGQGRKREGAEG